MKLLAKVNIVGRQGPSHILPPGSVFECSEAEAAEHLAQRTAERVEEPEAVEPAHEAEAETAASEAPTDPPPASETDDEPEPKTRVDNPRRTGRMLA